MRPETACPSPHRHHPHELEDIIKRVGVHVRLLASMASGVLICLLTGAALDHLDIP